MPAPVEAETSGVNCSLPPLAATGTLAVTSLRWRLPEKPPAHRGTPVERADGADGAADIGATSSDGALGPTTALDGFAAPPPVVAVSGVTDAVGPRDRGGPAVLRDAKPPPTTRS